MIDLDNWLEGRYRVPVTVAEEEGDDSARQSANTQVESE